MAAAFASASAAEKSAGRLTDLNNFPMADLNTQLAHGATGKGRKRSLGDEYNDHKAWPDLRSSAKRRPVGAAHTGMMRSHMGGAASGGSSLAGFPLGAARKRNLSDREDGGPIDENAKRNRCVQKVSCSVTQPVTARNAGLHCGKQLLRKWLRSISTNYRCMKVNTRLRLIA